MSGAERLKPDLAAVAARYPAVMQAGRFTLPITFAAAVALCAPLLLSWYLFGITWAQLLSGFVRLAQLIELMVPPSPGRYFVLFLHALGETLAIAFLGTLAAAVFALPLAILAARNTVHLTPLRLTIRRGFDTLRSIDALIWALIWINVMGLGPFAGVLAIMSSDFGALGKLFADTIEVADDRASEGIRAAGGSRIEEFRFGILPQVIPVIFSQMLYYFESNTRSATIIGVVGAGGIGLHLYEQIRTMEWQMVAFIVLMILVTVAIIDAISTRLQRAVMGTQPV